MKAQSILGRLQKGVNWLEDGVSVVLANQYHSDYVVQRHWEVPGTHWNVVMHTNSGSGFCGTKIASTFRNLHTARSALTWVSTLLLKAQRSVTCIGMVR